MKQRPLLSSFGAILFISLWEFWALRNAGASFFFPPPSHLFSTGYELFRTERWWNLLASSLLHYFCGLFVGLLSGFVFGICCAQSKTFGAIWFWPVKLLRPIPPLAWVPLSILWFGVTNAAATFVIASGVFWIIYEGVVGGMESIDPRYEELAKCFDRSGIFDRLWNVLLPACLPTLLPSLRSSFGLGWMLLIAAELAGVSGIGQFMWEASGLMATDKVLLCMLTIACCYMLIDACSRRLERQLAWWTYA